LPLSSIRRLPLNINGAVFRTDAGEPGFHCRRAWAAPTFHACQTASLCSGSVPIYRGDKLVAHRHRRRLDQSDLWHSCVVERRNGVEHGLNRTELIRADMLRARARLLYVQCPQRRSMTLPRPTRARACDMTKRSHATLIRCAVLAGLAALSMTANVQPSRLETIAPIGCRRRHPARRNV
jgi:hypothetical protein